MPWTIPESTVFACVFRFNLTADLLSCITDILCPLFRVWDVKTGACKAIENFANAVSSAAVTDEAVIVLSGNTARFCLC